MKKSIIWDLDNTIYPVGSIARHCLPFYMNFILMRTLFSRTIKPFPGYEEVKRMSHENYLVTDGITILQQSKIQQLHIVADFNAIYIIDPKHTKLTKKDVFRNIMLSNGYKTEELLVVGDDMDAEIKPAQELGIPAVLFDFKALHHEDTITPTITSLYELKHFLI